MKREVETDALLVRLRGRADMARNNAKTYGASGYPGEELRLLAMVIAYEQAVLDVVEAAMEPPATQVLG
jgi:hypothetical protein